MLPGSLNHRYGVTCFMTWPPLTFICLLLTPFFLQFRFVMEGHPVILNPGGTLLPMIALGGAGGIYQDSHNRDQVIKAPLKHNIQGCSQRVIESVREREDFSELCINREKLIYQTLPKDPNILDCLAITDRGIEFPYLRHGNVREYLQKHNNHLDGQIRDRWIKNAVEAVATIHAYGVVHSDISPRNFLVADDFSIKLCDFAGSSVNGLESLVEEESPYRILPWSPRTFQTDLFALGSFIYEVSTGVRPFAEIGDEEIERRYAVQFFPSLDGLKYYEVISRCWKSQYPCIDVLRSDILRYNQGSGWTNVSPSVAGHGIESTISARSFLVSTFAVISISSAVLWIYRRHHRL